MDVPPTPSPTPTGSSTAILPLILPHVSTAFRLTSSIPSYLVSHIPWTPFLTPLAYLLAPITTFISILLTLTLLTPYHFLSWFFDAIFPIYVLCGVACIIGGLLGLGARWVSLRIVRAAVAPLAIKDAQLYDDGDETGEEVTLKGIDDAALAERSAKRRRLGRKERDGKVKFEPSR